MFGKSVYQIGAAATRRDRDKRSWFAVVCFGSPDAMAGGRIHRNLPDAAKAARSAKGTGTCSAANVVVCQTRKDARNADISGGKVIYVA